MRTLVVSWLLVALNWCHVLAVESTQELGDINFSRHIQPILAEHCAQCHGVDEAGRKGGLRLDTLPGALSGGDSGQPAITPKDPGKSQLLRRIESKESGEVMPPPETQKTLSVQQIALLRKWIEQGASYETHWAFVTPQPRASLPGDVNPIDAFVSERLGRLGLSFATPVETNRLARRIYLDAIGIPPTPQQVEEFATVDLGESIDTLLRNDRFGEKWARHWLDVARYSDTNGYEKDLTRQQWAWRDWVVTAINRDLPYDQFIIEQIAGDLLPNPTQDQLIATGFLRNSMLNEEGAIIPEQFRMVEMFDRMDCIGKAILGLTTQCAQCHNHKYDPITQREYYGMFAYLNNAYEAHSGVYSPDQLQVIEAIHRSISETEQEIKSRMPDWKASLERWEHETRASFIPWETISFDELNSVSGLNHPAPQMDGSILMTGHTSGEVYMIGEPDLDGATALRFEVLNHGDLPHRGPGRNGAGLWQVHTIDMHLKKPNSEQWEKVTFSEAFADYSSEESKKGDEKNPSLHGPVKYLIDDKPNTFWSADRGPGQRNQPSVAVLCFAKALAAPKGTQVKIAIHMGDNVGCCRWSLTKSEKVALPPCNHETSLALDVASDLRSAEQSRAIFRDWCKSRKELVDLNSRIDGHWSKWPSPRTMVFHLREREPKLARSTYILERGEWDRKNEIVEPHVPASLHSVATTDLPPRLVFARWLVDPKSPLAARVAVNRVWQAIFGEGLVETSEDFGTRAPVPEYQDLLDQLASDFMKNGWSQKWLIKTILTSRTYQQSSVVRKELYEMDPKNRLLGRGPRFRVDAEQIRDIALSCAGLLHHQLGGPSIMPPVPQNVINFNYVVPNWVPATGADRYRRSLYVFRKRSMPDPVMSSLDAPNGDIACARRIRSNTPIAALVGLNEPVFVEAAQAMSLRVLTLGGTNDRERIAYAFQICTSRKPEDREIDALETMLKEQRRRIADGWLNPREIATGDASKLPGLPNHTTPQDAAAWTLACRVLLNLDETISKN